MKDTRHSIAGFEALQKTYEGKSSVDEAIRLTNEALLGKRLSRIEIAFLIKVLIDHLEKMK